MDLRELQRIEFLELLKAFGVANEGIVGQRVKGAGLVCDLDVDLVLVELILLGFVFDELLQDLDLFLDFVILFGKFLQLLVLLLDCHSLDRRESS